MIGLMFNRWAQVIGLLIFFLLLSSQNVFAQFADNQINLPEDRRRAVNPAPASRDFKAINDRHKILLAVIDTGVDYNHPSLEEHVHFNLDASGAPTGTGWDFAAEDAWPSPYVSPSADLDPQAPPGARGLALHVGKLFSDFATAYPQHSQSINGSRQFMQEDAGGLYHGTHVAGLAVYDEPRIGLLPYRALPINVVYKLGKQVRPDTMDTVVRAIRRAIQDGARVINLSLGIAILKDLETPPIDFEKMVARMAEVKKMAIENPQVAFIAATGNNGTWIDENARQALPCGVEAKNILCVGALDPEGGIASFTNIVLPDYPFLLAPGQNIVSLTPTLMCQVPGYLLQGFLDPRLMQDATMKEFYFKSVAQYCEQTTGFAARSGTSMAAPLAARLVAKELLRNMNQSGAQAIQNVLNAGTDLKVGRLVIRRVKVDRPSWYPEAMTLSNGATRPFFEFYGR